jgi:hypothetical protein
VVSSEARAARALWRVQVAVVGSPAPTASVVEALAPQGTGVSDRRTSDNVRRFDVFRKVDGAAPAGRPPGRPRLPDEAERLVDATAKRCLQLILDAIRDDPEPLVVAILVGHFVHGTLLGLAAERCSPAVRERLARDAAEAIARAVREAAP